MTLNGAPETVHLSSEQYDAEQVRLMEEVCILLDRDDRNQGPCSKKDCHLMSNINKGLLHRAFSLFLFSGEGKLLLQQRASEKITFPDMWTNTCCSHPLHIAGEQGSATGEADSLAASIEGVKRAAQRKVEQELGIQAKDAPVDKMHFLTRIHYLAPSDGQWGEHEIDYILFLQHPAAQGPKLAPNPNEVRDVRWVSQEDLRDMFSSNPENLTYTPWFKLICESFLFKWWDSLSDLSAHKDEAIHRMGV
jgi:isopentenyl-diphosphate delta-isomerase